MTHYLAYGDCALLINFEQKIDSGINEKVLKWTKSIESLKLPGITFILPAYCSITVGYNPEKLNFDTLKNQILALSEHLETSAETEFGRSFEIPVCYEAEFAMDQEDLTKILQLPFDTIIQQHTDQIFRVYMLGFLPGFVYMGKLPKALSCPRKDHPRVKVPAQSVGLAGYQTGIYPSDAPGGWQIIGRTPLKIFDPEKENPFLFKAGDQVQFKAISKEQFYQIEEDYKMNRFQFKDLYG